MADQKPFAQQYQTPLGPMGLDDMINRAASINGVDPEWIRAMTHQEDPTRDPAAVSPKGAVGHMQVMPDSYFKKGARSDYRSDISWMDPATNQMRTGVNIHDPYENVMGGVAYFKSLLDRYGGDRTKALAAYNAGPKRVDEAGGVPRIGETQDYVSKIEGRLGAQQPAIAGGGLGAQPSTMAGGLNIARRPAIEAQQNVPAIMQPPGYQPPGVGGLNIQPGAQIPGGAARTAELGPQMPMPQIEGEPSPALALLNARVEPPLLRGSRRPDVHAITAEPGTADWNAQLARQLQERSELAAWQQANQSRIGRVLNTIGDIIAPGIMSNIPGTERYREAQGAAAQREADELQKLQIEQDKLRVQRSQFLPTPNGVVRFDPVNGQVSYLQDDQGNRIFEEKGLDDFIGGKIAAGMTPDKDPRLAEAMQAQRFIKGNVNTPFAWAQQNMLPIIDKLEKYGYPTDDANLRQSADLAYQRHQISQPEHTTVGFGLSFGQSPASRVEVYQAETPEAMERKFAGKQVQVPGPQGSTMLMSWDDAKKLGYSPTQVTEVPSGTVDKNRAAWASVKTTMTMLDQYRKDLNEIYPKLTRDQRDALRVLTDTMTRSAPGMSVLGDIWQDIPLLGPVLGQMNQYENSILAGAKRSDQWDILIKPGNGGEKLASDWASMIVENLANLKQTQGQIPRNETYLAAETLRIPQPYIDPKAAEPDFQNFRLSVKGRTGGLMIPYTAPR